MEQINLHFTGDLHAITSAHNLCSAILDNHLHRGNELEIDTNRIFWPRVIDMNDRTLRQVSIGLGALQLVSPVQRDSISPQTSEVMAILSLSKSYDDLRERLGRIIVAESNSGKPVTAEDLGAKRIHGTSPQGGYATKPSTDTRGESGLCPLWAIR